MATRTDLINKSNQSKNIITYVIIGVVFLVALWLSTQSEGPSKFPKEVTDKFTFTAWVNDGEDYCLLYTSPSPRDSCASRMPSSA